MNKKQKEKQSFTHIPEDHKIVIELYKRFAYDKKDGKIKEAINHEGLHNYQRHDLMGLQELLYRFNSTLHDIKTEFKQWGKIVRKIQNVIIEQDEDNENIIKIGLSIDEAKFLKEYLLNFNDKDGKSGPPLVPSALFALPSVLEQLE